VDVMDNRPDQASRLCRNEVSAREETSPSLKELEALSLEEARQRLRELQVYHNELETRNEELRRSRKELEAARKRYFDLYGLAAGNSVLTSRGEHALYSRSEKKEGRPWQVKPFSL